MHNRLRSTINRVLGTGVEQLCLNLEVLVGLGGLSESGKSSHAEYLRTERDYYRLKLASVDRDYQALFGRRPKPDETVLAVLRFIHSHHFAHAFSVESLHRQEMAIALKNIFGNRFVLVYCDAPVEVRRQPAAAELLEGIDVQVHFIHKEQTKISRGANRIAIFADLVLDTHGQTFTDSTKELEQFIQSHLGRI